MEKKEEEKKDEEGEDKEKEEKKEEDGPPKKKPKRIDTYFEMNANTIDGKTVKLADLCKDKKATLVVNVASESGFTKDNYA